MEITFVRTGGKHDRVYAKRSDGSETSWTFPTYGDEVPHDLVHLVVEAVFDLRDGIYAHVDRGVEMARVNEIANRLGGAKKYERQGLGSPDILVSEALAAGAWSFEDIADDFRVQKIADACVTYGVTSPPSLTAARVARARELLHQLRSRWSGLRAKEAIKLSFNPASPASSLETL